MARWRVGVWRGTHGPPLARCARSSRGRAGGRRGTARWGGWCRSRGWCRCAAPRSGRGHRRCAAARAA
eukprot:3408291-Prymnesium_polylepis.1